MSSYPEVTVTELAKVLAEGAVLFDVREPDEYVAGHAPGAVLVPLGEVPDRVDEFPTGTTVYLICKSGGRSGRACEFLQGHGIDVVNVAGGTMSWISAGHPVVLGEEPS